MTIMKKGKWYWVKIKDEWFPAMYDPSACGGWTNQDTWEDFDGAVVAWQDIAPPKQAANKESKMSYCHISAESDIYSYFSDGSFIIHLGDEMFVVHTLEEFSDKLNEIRKQGYKIPQKVFDRIEKEQK